MSILRKKTNILKWGMEELGDLTQCYNQQGYCIGGYDRIRWPADMNIGSTCTTDIDPFARIHNSHNIHKE